ncbi:MAG TPA: hypothetical protein VM096_08415, partial [Vicinamibacterales bacterium]|nr:hypothetical protein [Vicinamibacterales bacterium]
MAEPSQTTPRPRGRRIWRWLGFGLLAISVLIALLVVGLQTLPARRYAASKVTALLAQQGITFSTDQLRYNLLDLSGELRNVRILSPNLPDGPPFLEIDRARVDLSAWQLLRGRYVVESGSAEGVRLHYFINADGVDNLPRPVSDPDAPSEPVDYLIADLNVPDASVRFEDRVRNIDLSLPRASLTMKGHALTSRHDITIDAPGGDARVQDRQAHIDRINLAVDLGREDVKVTGSEISAEGALARATGSYGPFDQPIVDLTLQATLDSARAIQLARVNESVAGQVSIEATVKGPTSALAIDGRVTSPNLQFRDLKDLTVDTAATYDTAGNIVRVKNLRVSGPLGTIAGNGEVAIAGGSTSKVNATVDAVRAEPIMAALHLPYRVATRVDGRINAEWPGLDYAKANGTAQLSFDPTARSVTRLTLPIGGRIDVAGNGNDLTATLRGVHAAGTTVDGRVSLRDRDRLDGTLQARTDNAATTISNVEAFLGRAHGSLAPMAVAGAISANARLGATLKSPSVTATVTAPSLTIGESSGIGVDGRLAYRGETVTIESLDVAWQDARANASGSIALSGNRAIDLAVRADALQVSGLLRAAELSDIPASGTLSSQAQVGGTLDNPIANLHVLATDLTAYNEVVGTLAADGRFAGRRLDVNRLQLDKPQPGGDGRITGTASYQLSSQQYAVDLASQNIKLLTLQLPGGQHVTGGVDLTARGTGTVTSPAGTINLRAADLVVDQRAIGNVVADTTLANGQATTTMSADRFGLKATSAIGTSSPYPATITADINDLDLAALPIDIQTPLEGRLRAHVDARGPLSDPQSGTANATVESFAGSFRQQPFTLEGPARLQYADERLTIDQMRLRAQDSTIAVSGNLPLLDRAAPGTITIDANANLATLAQYAPVGSEIAADGRLILTGTLQGTLKAIDPNLHLSLENAMVVSPAIEPGISNLTATASVADGTATVDKLTANWGTAQIDMSARVPLDLLPQLPVEIPRRGGPATIHARVDGLDPSSIPGAPAGLTGRISLDADVAATRPDIREAVGKLVFRDLQLGFAGLTLEQKGPSTIAVRDGVAAIEQFNLGGSVGTLAAKGTVGLTGDRALNVDVDGGLNIAALSLVTDLVRAEGASTIDIAARGTIAEPILSGNVAITDGTLLVDEPRIAAEALNARIDLDQNRIVLSSLTAAVNGGTLTGKGGLAIRGGGVEDVNVELAAR